MTKPVVWVLGDVMLDVAVRRPHFRRSPEDPSVPVLPEPDYAVDECRAGGAANLAVNLSAMGCDVHLFCNWPSMQTYDPTAEQLATLLSAARVACKPKLPATKAVTTKARFYEGERLVARLDRDVDAAGQFGLPISIESGPRPDALVITDYGRGAVNRTSAHAWSSALKSAFGTAVYADPKLGREWVWDLYDENGPLTTDSSGVAEVDVFVANWAETVGFGCAEPDAEPGDDVVAYEAATSLAEKLGVESAVVKRGKFGSAWASPPSHGLVPAVNPHEVRDVQGCGDTYLAGLVAGRCRELDLPDACLLASAAAGIAAGRQGTAVVSLTEAAAALKPLVASPRGLTDFKDVATLAARLRGFGLKVGFVNGCFDLAPTPGHLAVLDFAAKRCDFLFVGLDADERVKALKGPERPFVPQAERAAVIGSLRNVGAAFVFPGDPSSAVAAVRPHVMVKDESYRGKKVIGADLLTQWGGELAFAPLISADSTTTRVERVYTRLRSLGWD